MGRQAKTERGNTHSNIAGMPESGQASAEHVPIKGAELSDSYDACDMSVDKRPSGALLVL